MGAALLNLQAYWQRATIYLVLIIFSLLVLNWLVINALAEHPQLKEKLRRISLTDALFFACVPPVFYFLAPYGSDIMAALGTSSAKFREFVSLVLISIGLGLACYLFVLDTVFLGKSLESEHS